MATPKPFNGRAAAIYPASAFTKPPSGYVDVIVPYTPSELAQRRVGNNSRAHFQRVRKNRMETE